ncbi:glycosyl hydrolase [uncultured Victivallis sp.]|uniref:glycosyl hydrolase n=1 Tax=uncultured Victivallis sp. TaxID=354118 RepID=UPI002591D81F|nr:glycosyl hydrolase [uncultured Victivallis sp.]
MTILRTLFLAAAASAVLSSGAAASPWGIAAHPMKSYEWDHIDKEVAMMREAGITMLRTDLQFSRVARAKGSYDFSACDALLAKLDGTGISLLPILSGYDWEIQSCRPDAVPLYKHPGEWRNFVRAAAEHYKGRIRVWEIWNEPDGGFWKPQPNAEQYAQLLKIAHEELKKADPANQVMVGGLCGWEASYLADLYAAGAGKYFDLVAVHPYGKGPDSSPFQARSMAKFRRVMARHGDSAKPVWITECGGPSHRSNLISQQPDALIRAIRFAAEQIGRKLPAGELTVGAPVSQEFPDRDFETTRSWLPGVRIAPVTPQQLAAADPARLPVMIATEHITLEEPFLKPMQSYLRRGGILLAFGEVPLYNLRYRNDKGNWALRGAASELHPGFRIGFQAWWTKPGLPKQTTRVKTLEAGKAAGIIDLKNIYVTRFLTPDNLKKGDTYTPLVDALDGNGNSIGQGLALYTFGDWKGAVLGCTMQFAGGITEQEQADLLQTLYLSYLANGVEKLFYYNFHNDGTSPAEREHNFGLVRWDYTPKPAYRAYRAMTAALGRAPKFASRLPGLPPEVQALIFERAEGGRVLALWTTKPEVSPAVNCGGKSLRPTGQVQYIPLP